MQHLLRHFIFILVLIALSFWAILPLDVRLRKGKDLNGGATLVYQVELKPTDPPDTMDRMIDLLRKRVDPDGLLEVSMVPLGKDRIEITMPLPNERVKKLKASFEEELQKLADAPSSVGKLEGILPLPADQRAAEIAKLAGSDAKRKADLESAAAAYDRKVALKLPYEEGEKLVEQAQAAVAAAANEEAKQTASAKLEEARRELIKRAGELADADIAYSKAIGAIGAAGASPTQVRRALELSSRGRVMTDPATKQKVSIPSARQRALDAIYTANPGAKDQIDRVVKAWETYQSQRSTLDDPADLKRILRGAGVLTFRIAVRTDTPMADLPRLRQELRTGGPKAVQASNVRWFKINKEDSWIDSPGHAEQLLNNTAQYFEQRYRIAGDKGPDGSIYILCYDEFGKRLTRADGAWGLAGARQSVDELGRPSIAFQMDAVGGVEMGKLTGANVGMPMAVLLDDEVYTAPNINSRIGASGQISGSFTQTEINYIVRVLSAGSMAAKLSPEPISESSVGPELGADNLTRGLLAGAVSFVLISGFMIAYYFSGGIIATVALAINLLFLLALMAINSAAFSLPGIAGVILAFGMAVDANVLIYERLREEISKGEPLRVAVRMAYSRALAPILDGNLTHLITCIVLGFTGTPEIRGFAITMSIGVVTTLICQLYITRVIYFWLVDVVKLKKVRMLPLVWPGLQRALTLQVDWMRLRPIFYTISTLAVVGSLIAVVARGESLLDTVFRGGTRVTVQLKTDNGQQVTASRDEMQKRIKAVVAEDKTGQLRDLADPQILVIDPRADNTSGRFIVQTTITNKAVVEEALAKAFDGLLDQQVALSFDGDNATAENAPIVPVLAPDLGDVLRIPGLRLDVTEFMGGAAVKLENLGPVKPTLAGLEDRLRQMRTDSRFGDTLGRMHKFVVTKGTPQAVESAIVLVRDDVINYMKDSEGQRRWSQDMKPQEWLLVTEAMKRATTFAGVETFDPSIANTFAGQAVAAVILSTVAIIVFVWVRFNSLRYSLAAIIATLHDCIIALGAIAVAEILYKHFFGLSSSLGILPFKIDLNVIAAVLTILGYSLNDKIVIMDRIRENRGKLPYATRRLINDSVNQTISRTIMTGTTVFIASGVLYVMGGEALRAFAYCFLIGVVVGTYSSIAVAAPIVWSKKSDPTARRDEVGSGRLAAKPA